MPTTVRIATFNLKKLDNEPGAAPTLADRIEVLRPQLERLRADILCLQEVGSQIPQGQPAQPPQLLALDQLIAGTAYAGFAHRACSVKPDGSIFADRNLVILSRWPIAVSDSIFYKYVQPPEYLPATAVPRPNAAVPQHGDRPVLYAKVKLTNALFVHVVNVHLKSKIPTTIDGQAVPGTSKWNTVPGWAEGSFLSSMKRVGQALDTRRFIDTLFDVEPNAWVAVCGDFNADTDDVPVQAIRGEVEDTLNADLAPRVIVPCERTVPESSRFSLLHRGKGCMFDHMLVSRPMLAFYRGTEIHNESLRDESIHLQVYVANPGSDHAPVVAGFELP